VNNTELIRAIAELTEELRKHRDALSISKASESREWLSIKEFAKLHELNYSHVYGWVKAAELGRNGLKEGTHYRKFYGGVGERSRIQIHRDKFTDMIQGGD
jgi:hypothetical protein